MKREYEFKMWKGLVKFFAYTLSDRPFLIDGTFYGYNPATMFHCEEQTLGMDGVAE